MKDDPWTPPPLYEFKNEDHQVEKVNDEIPPNYAKIVVGNIQSDLQDIHIIIHLQYTNEKNIDEPVNLKPGTQNFGYARNVNLDKDFKIFNRKILKIYLVQRTG
jgi:hypothetical protein